MTTQGADFAVYDPSFMKEKIPDLYTQEGGPMTPERAHAYFLKQSEKIINEIANLIIAERQNGGDLQALFNKVISYTSKCRAVIATKQGTWNSDKEGFGIRRDARMGKDTCTILQRQYRSTSDKILELFIEYIDPLQQGIPSIVLRDECDGRISTLTLSLLHSADFTPELIYEGVSSTFLKDELVWIAKQNSCTPDPEIQLKIKTIRTAYQLSYPISYDKCFKNSGIKEVYANCLKPVGKPSEFSYLYGLLTTEYQGKRCELTRYIMGMHNTDFQFSVFNLLHQDSLFLQDTLDESAAFFVQAISWDGRSIKQLKDIMAHFCYLSAHNMRDFRGTAAQTEWITHAIFRSLGLFYAEDKSTMVDLEAFANPLFSKFRTRYHEIVQLHPIVKKSKEGGIIGGCVI